MSTHPFPTRRSSDLQSRIRSSEIDAPEMQAPNPVSARSETDRLLDRLHRAALSDDGRENHAIGRDYLRSPNGQAWRQDVQEYSQARQTREQQAAWEAQQLQKAAAQTHPHERESGGAEN